ncbi:MAG: CAP domain-containing protein [Comamonadaceae bacterium]|nr:MAG: CAP domain-containing protein [Comamonadaceae bacterium]
MATPAFSPAFVLRSTVAFGFAALLAACGGGSSSESEPLADAELISRTMEASGPAEAAATAHYARLSEVRAKIGLGTLKWNGKLAQAAQGHADYLAMHREAGHEQTPDTAGFTGVSIADRVRAAGYAGQLVQETKAGGQSRTAAEGRERMDALLLAPLHRLQLLAPEFDEAGVGVAAQGGPLVTDLGASGNRTRARERRWMYPYNGQAGVGAAFAPGTEVGLPDDLPQWTGTPLTLSGFLFSMVSYSAVALQEEQTGVEVPLLAQVPPGEIRAALVFFPLQPLKPATHYVWRITATVDRMPATTVAKFITAEAAAAGVTD